MKQLVTFCKQNKYTWIMLYLIAYLVIFFLLDTLITPRYIVSTAWDAHIPFISAFIFPYMLWFPGLLTVLVRFMLHDRKDFSDLWFIMFTGMNLCFIIYVLIPNGLELRVQPAEHDYLGRVMGLIWSLDPPVNVCPSLHVTSSTAAMVAALKAGHLKGQKKEKWLICAFFALVIASTVFVKQHSIVDVAAGAAVTAVLALICYHTPWRRLFRGRFRVLVET